MPYACIPSTAPPPGQHADGPTLLAEVSRKIDASIRQHPGGYAEVARKLGQTEKQLSKSIENLGRSDSTRRRGRSKLGIIDAQAITNITGDVAWVRDWCGSLGLEMVLLPPPTSDSAHPQQHIAIAMSNMALYLCSCQPPEIDARVQSAVALFNRFAEVVLELGAHKIISLNQLGSLSVARMDVVSSLVRCPLGELRLRLVLQVIADAGCAAELLTRRHAQLPAC